MATVLMKLRAQEAECSRALPSYAGEVEVRSLEAHHGQDQAVRE